MRVLPQPPDVVCYVEEGNLFGIHAVAASMHSQPFARKDPRSDKHYLPRLPRPFYQADATVHGVLTTHQRELLPLNEVLHLGFRELLLHCCHRHQLLCPVYCLMPDHVHLVCIGLHPESDQLNAMAFLRTHLARIILPAALQHQAYDSVYQESNHSIDSIRRWIQYAAQNPVMAHLAGSPDQWPWMGCVVPGIPRLHPLEDRFWDVFGRLHRERRHPDCDRHVRPMLV